MKSILKATAVLGSASIVSILMGVVSAKVSAVLLGPNGMGYMGLLQSLLGLSGLIAGMGVGTALVRAGARALSDGDARGMAALRGASWLLWGVLGGAAALLMTLARAPLSMLMLGDPNHGNAVALIAVGLLLAQAAGVQMCILNAHQRLGALARNGVLSSVLGVSFTLLVIWRWRAAAIPWAVLANCAVAWAVSAYYMMRHAPRPAARATRRELLTAAWALLRFGGPYTASMLVGAGVLMAMPVLVLHALDTEAVGFYRAAAAVSVNYLGFVTASMAQDYYPRVSAVGNQHSALCRLINEQHRLVLLLGGPIILGMLALVPYLVPLIYSSQFAPTVALLEWQLLGDIFKFAAWTMAFVILARSGSLTYFCVELVGGTSLLLFSWLGVRWLGLEGLGIGFVVCAGVGYLLCWTILRRSIGLRWTRDNVLLLVSLVLLAFLIRLLPYLGLMRVRTPIALALAAMASAYSLRALWGEVGGLGGLLARRGRAPAAPPSTGKEVPGIGEDPAGVEVVPLP
jgi:PST family polysaccharide transporter